MRLIKSGTLTELHEGDLVQLRRSDFRISCIDPDKKQVFLIDEEAEKPPFSIPPGAIGAEWA